MRPYHCSLFRRFALSLGISSAVAGAVSGQALFVKPVKVLGDPNFIGTAVNPLAFDSVGPNLVEGRELQGPQGIALDTTGSITSPAVYIADTANNRVLAFQYPTQLKAGSFADLILGQPDRFTTNPGGSTGVATGLRLPTGMAVDQAGNLYVADTGNNRILRYPKPFAQRPGASGGSEFPDLVIGQTSFSGTSANPGGVSGSTLSLLLNGGFAGRTGLAFDSSGNLWVADTGNNRVLRYPASALSAGQNGPAADIVIGQANLTSAVSQTIQTATQGLNLPSGIAFDSQGRLFVSDQLDRVLQFQPNPSTNASALRIMGVDASAGGGTPTQIGFGAAVGIAIQNANIFVSDASNNRVLVFGPPESWPAQTTQFSPSAQQVIGQTNFTAAAANAFNPAPNAMVLSSPTDVAASSGELFVADSMNNRVLAFPIGSTTGQAATRVIGQLDFIYSAPNLVEGREFHTSVQGPLSGAAAVDQSSSPRHLYVADTGNNRILGYNDLNSAMQGQKADLVIGQPDLMHTLINYPSGSAGQPSAQGLNSPTALAVDSAGNLYVADTLNARVLRFPAPFASNKTAGESADLVLGQQDFTSQLNIASAHTMVAPIGLAFTQAGANAANAQSGWLAVSDASANRVLMFPKPFATGESATIVIGQTNLSDTSSGAQAQQLTSPTGIAIDSQDRVLIVDSGNNRIQIFPAASQLPSTSASASVSLTSGLSEPLGVAINTAGDFWVANLNTSSLLHFPKIDNLPLEAQPYTSDASLPAIQPRGAYADRFGNLLVTDGINRVLYFTPQVFPVNAANSIPGRALAGGTIASIYPYRMNVLAPSTEPATTLPLTTTLANTQVLVNGAPSPLIYASPAQINLVLPNSLAAGGTANVQVLNSSTGQIYGAAEITLASASPGLFDVNTQQVGPAAALNQDNTVNSSSNPIPRGQTIQLFGTGQGYVPNGPADGQPASGLLLTSIQPQVTLGSGSSVIGVPASNVTSALAPGFVGLWQINVKIPDNAPTGAVPVLLYMNSIPSNNPSNPGQVVTTIAIK